MKTSTSKKWLLLNLVLLIATSSVAKTGGHPTMGYIWPYAVNNSNATSPLPLVVCALATPLPLTGITTAKGNIAAKTVAAHSWTGTLSNIWGIAGNWSLGILPDSTSDVTIPTGLANYPNVIVGVASVNNLTIQAGASLTVSGAILQIGGSITNNGSFVAVNGTIILNGTTPQTIPANAFTGNTVKNIIISNNVSLAGQDTLTGLLAFGPVSGKTFNTGGFLTLKSNAAGTATVADITNAGTSSGNSITGTVTMERWVKLRQGGVGRAYRLLASTVILPVL
jgi:hypothetical protein